MPEMTIECDAKNVRFVCWIPKAKNTNTEYVTLIAFPLQKWLYVNA